MSHPGVVASCPLSPPPLFLQRTSRPLSPGNSSKPKPERSQISTNICLLGLCSIYFFSVTNKTSPKKFENRRKKRNPPIHTKPHKTHQTRPPFFGRHLPKSPSPPQSSFPSPSNLVLDQSSSSSLSLSIPSPVLRAGFTYSTTLDLWYVWSLHYLSIPLLPCRRRCRRRRGCRQCRPSAQRRLNRDPHPPRPLSSSVDIECPSAT